MAKEEVEVVIEPVARGAANLVGGRIVAIFSAFLLQVAMARMLGVEDYGLFGLIISILTWIEIVHWGIGRAATLQVAITPSQARGIESRYARYQIGISLILMAVGIGLSFLLQAFVDREGALPFFLLSFMDIPLLSLYCLYLGLLNGLRRQKYAAMSLATYYVSRLVFCVLLVAAGLSLYGAIIGNFLCSLAGLSVGTFYFRRLTSVEGKGFEPKGYEVLKKILPFMVVSLVFNVSLNINLWLVGLLGSDKDLGIYNAAFSMSRVIFVLFSGLTIALFPAIVSSLSEGAVARSRRMLQQSFRFLFLFILPILTYAAISGDVILNIFGKGYVSGAPYLSLLIMSFSIASILYILNDLHMAGGRYYQVIACNLLAVAIEVTCCLLLIPRMGMAGSATAMAIALTVASAPMVISTNRMLAVRLNLFSLGRITLAAALSSLPLFFTHSILTTIIAYPFCILIYVTALIYSGELSFDEIKHWRDMVIYKKV